MAEFPGLPEDIYEYRNEFTYSTWTPGTRVTFVNVPWDSAYRDIVSFASDSARNAYFASLKQAGETIELTGMSYLRYGEPVRVNLPFAAATRFNYLIVENPVMPVPTKPGYASADVFYYFILDASYVAPNTTMLNVQLDVWQTYGNRCTFDRCYVERGHIGIANSNSTRYNLADYLTDLEGLNIGDEYEVVHQEYVNLAPYREDGTGLTPWAVFMSTTKLDGDLGTVENPVMKTSQGNRSGGMAMGCQLYCCKAFTFYELMVALSDFPWVTQGIQYVTLIPESMLAHTYENLESVEIQGVTIYQVYERNRTPDYRWVKDFFSNFEIPQRYRNLDKLYTFPYCAFEMTYQSGGEIVMKPECLKIDASKGDELGLWHYHCVVPPDVREVVVPEAYNAVAGAQGMEFASYDGSGGIFPTKILPGEGLDMALVITDFPQLSVVNNMYQYYLASHANQINYNYATADWSQQKAIMGAQLGYNQASMNMATQENLNRAQQDYNTGAANINMQRIQQSAMINAAENAAPALQGDIVQGAAGAAAAVARGVTDYNAANMMLGANNALLQTNLGYQQEQLGYNRDTNYEYATAAAQGDYELAIQGIQAKVQDAAVTQPTTSGQMGGKVFNMVNGMTLILFKWKRIKPNFMRQVGDFFLRYGYYVNRWLVPPANLRCCENFTYWKMQQVALSTTEVPEVFKQAIRGIFEKGVTVWSDPRKMWKIELDDNEPLGGVSY